MCIRDRAPTMAIFSIGTAPFKEKRGNPCGFPLVTQLSDLIQRLALGELETGAGGFSAVLLALFYAGVAGDETGLFEDTAQFGVVQ